MRAYQVRFSTFFVAVIVIMAAFPDCVWAEGGRGGLLSSDVRRKGIRGRLQEFKANRLRELEKAKAQDALEQLHGEREKRTERIEEVVVVEDTAVKVIDTSDQSSSNPTQCWDKVRERYVDCSSIQKRYYNNTRGQEADCWNFSEDLPQHCKDLLGIK